MLKYSFYNEKGFVYYIDGESLEDIADEFTTTVRLIITDNNLEGEPNVGDMIYVKPHSKSYIVRPEDSLKSISVKFNTTEEEILRINRVEYIYSGQKLIFDY